MLEVKWKAQSVPFELMANECFNPCYVGSKMERIFVLSLFLSFQECFNPCYVGSKMESY